MSYNSDIILIGEELSEGQSVRVVCPACLGGTSEEKSLSITKNDGVVWQCFRSKCGVKGATNGVSFSKGDKPVAKATWEGTTHDLPNKVAERILSMWGISEPPNWYWTTDFGGRVAMSIRSPTDAHRGWVLRSLNPGGTKALTYGEGPSWYLRHKDKPTWLVEDIPSAVRTAKYTNSVALLGTAISTDTALELATHVPNGIVLALDQDATRLAFQLYNRYRGLWKQTQIQPLKQDLKDMNEADLKELLA
jgi:hypothetical protein